MGVNTLTQDQALGQIKDGDLMFVSKHRNIVSAAIRFVTKSHFSHCAICFWVDIAGIPRLLVIEARGGAERRLVSFQEYETYDRTIVAAPKPWQTYAASAVHEIGNVPYSYLEATYVGIREFLSKYLGIKIKQRDFSGEICSEFIARMLGMSSVDVSPEDLYEQVLSTSSVRFNISKEKSPSIF
jgi:hypothetical protein